jgi:hypothetical protein
MYAAHRASWQDPTDRGLPIKHNQLLKQPKENGASGAPSCLE